MGGRTSATSASPPSPRPGRWCATPITCLPTGPPWALRPPRPTEPGGTASKNAAAAGSASAARYSTSVPEGWAAGEEDRTRSRMGRSRSRPPDPPPTAPAAAPRKAPRRPSWSATTSPAPSASSWQMSRTPCSGPPTARGEEEEDGDEEEEEDAHPIASAAPSSWSRVRTAPSNAGSCPGSGGRSPARRASGLLRGRRRCRRRRDPPPAGPVRERYDLSRIGVWGGKPPSLRIFSLAWQGRRRSLFLCVGFFVLVGEKDRYYEVVGAYPWYAYVTKETQYTYI